MRVKRVVRKISFYLVFFFSICFLTFGETEIDTEKIIYQSNMDKLNQLTIKIFQVNNEEDVKTILEN